MSIICLLSGGHAWREIQRCDFGTFSEAVKVECRKCLARKTVIIVAGCIGL